MPVMTQETYLGDGLYASYDGYQIKLRAPRVDGDHEIYLDDMVTLKLMEFIGQALHGPKAP
jgi:hypothetical protein